MLLFICDFDDSIEALFLFKKVRVFLDIFMSFLNLHKPARLSFFVIIASDVQTLILICEFYLRLHIGFGLNLKVIILVLFHKLAILIWNWLICKFSHLLQGLSIRCSTTSAVINQLIDEFNLIFFNLFLEKFNMIVFL